MVTLPQNPSAVNGQVPGWSCILSVVSLYLPFRIQTYVSYVIRIVENPPSCQRLHPLKDVQLLALGSLAAPHPRVNQISPLAEQRLLPALARF